MVELKRSDAEAIAKKLNAEIRPQTKHDVAYVKVDDVLVGKYGIRRDRGAPHSYIPKQIGVSASEAKRLSTCTMSKEQYEKKIRNSRKNA